MERCLEDKVAIITGGSQGLGVAIARKYLEAGASVVLCARNAALLEQVAADLDPLRSAAQRLVAIPADVAKPDAVEALVREATQRLGRLDILVNNAGVYGPKGAIEDVDWQEWIK